jgi:hypothetical protein
MGRPVGVARPLMINEVQAHTEVKEFSRIRNKTIDFRIGVYNYFCKGNKKLPY